MHDFASKYAMYTSTESGRKLLDAYNRSNGAMRKLLGRALARKAENFGRKPF